MTEVTRRQQRQGLYLLLDLEITGLFFPWRLLSPGYCQSEAREEESYGLKSCCHYCCYTME